MVPNASRTLLSTLLLVLAATGCAQAQGQRGARMMQQLEQRFASADRDHDGRLTREEARQGMPWAERNFDAIDTTRSGAIDLAQLKNFARAQGSQRRAGSGASPAQ
jgi:Ca2+-binding EF-hand superfamily protein